jgi:hypothetical protein
VGEHIKTNANVIIVVPKGLEGGTNITYYVDKWYDLGSVTTNKVPAVATKLEQYKYQLNVANNASNNITIEASAKISDRLANLGIVDKNAYTPAVMKWLTEGVDAYGTPWANRDKDDIHLADVIDRNDAVLTNLNLTAMYWLDMDPTIPDQALKAYTDGLDASQENPRIAVHMSITNRTSGTAYTPYVLRGLEPGSTSWDYNENSPWGWTSVTFKVTGILNNGAVDTSNFSKDWIPLRWFVFQPESFRPLDDPDHPGVSFIDIHNPHSTESPGYWAGWYNYPNVNNFLFKFTIDTRLKPYTVETLKQDNEL